MLSRHVAATMIATLVLPLIATAESVEIPLRFENSGDHEDVAPYGSAYVELADEKPTGLTTAPEFKSDKPRFGTVELGETTFVFALDAGGEDPSRYDTVYFDQDHDGDLTNDPVLEGEVIEFDEGGIWFVDFDEDLTVEYTLDGVQLPYVLSLSLQGQDMSKLLEQLPEGFDVDSLPMGLAVHTSFSTGCFYAGSVTLGDETYRFRLGDSDCDGRFGEVAFLDDRYQYPGDSFYAQGDNLFVTVEEEFEYTDSVLFGNLLVVADRVFQLGVAIPEKKMSLTPVTEGLFPLVLSQEPERLVMHSKGFDHTVMMIEPGEEVMVPAGEYRLLNYTLLGVGEHDDLWRLGASATKKSPFVTVPDEGEATLEFGEPFVATAGVPSWYMDQMGMTDGEGVRLEFSIRGSGNESVSQLDRIYGETSACAMSKGSPRQPLEPTYTIVKKTGEQVKKASFEYG